MVSRRRFLSRTAAFTGALAFSSLLPPWAKSGHANVMGGVAALSGQAFTLDIGAAGVTIDGRPGRATTVNGLLPAPLLRWREGDDLTIEVRNHLEEETSIHWHGILLPFQMDGVPGISFPGIGPGETFTYRFPVRQAGTYWYHSHSGLQEQGGLSGPLIIEPRDRAAQKTERDYILFLSDWTFDDPATLFARLKKNGESFNYGRRTIGEFFEDVGRNGLGATLKERAMWGGMRMSPTDLLDITGATYTYLVNGHGPADNWTGLFTPGERVRLRVINGSAMTIFNVRIPGLAMTVVSADGQDVEPVETDEFQIGAAETYDVIVTPRDDRAYTVMCEAMDRSGYGRATLAPRIGITAAIPALRKPPRLAMRDMGMAHDMAGMDMKGMDMGGAGKGAVPDPAAMDHAHMDHSQMTHAMPGMETAEKPAIRKGVGVDNVVAMPMNRLAERGIGLEDVPHRVLVYTDLKALAANPDRRPPGREIEVHLTGNMARYMWSFDGVKFSDAREPILFHQGERLRLTLVNDTMMAHPIHLHGMFCDLVTAETEHKPRKHTVLVKPAGKLSMDITADAYGDWAFHCHLLYHMHAGMMRVVAVRPLETAPAAPMPMPMPMPEGHQHDHS